MSLLNLSLKIIAPMLLVAALGSGGVAAARAASNVVPATKAGDGAGVASGYTVSAEHYTLNGADPTLVDAVEFTVNSVPVAGSTLRVRLVSSGTDWYACTNTGTAVTCDTTSPQATALTIDQVRVVIAD